MHEIPVHQFNAGVNSVAGSLQFSAGWQLSSRHDAHLVLHKAVGAEHAGELT